MRLKGLCAYFFAALLLFISAASAQDRYGMESDRPETDDEYTPDAPAEGYSVPPALTLPAGTLVSVRTTQPLSSDRNRSGDSFTTILDQSIVVQGWVVARRGQTVMGRVVEARKTGRSNASSELALSLDELSLVDGQPLPIQTELVQISNGSRSRMKNEGATVGATTGTGAVIGAIAGGGPGAAIGAAIGAVAGVAGVLGTRGRPTELYPESQLTFRLQRPVTISTEQSRHAFAPVNESDYNRGPARRAARNAVRNPDRYPSSRRYPSRPRYYEDEDYDYPRYSPEFDLNFYSGPIYYPGPRVYFGTRYRVYSRW